MQQSCALLFLWFCGFKRFLGLKTLSGFKCLEFGAFKFIIKFV